MKRIDVAIAVVGHAGRLLICRRRASDHLGGFWEFPGGKIDPGETPADCAIREVREELELAIQIVEPFNEIEHTYSDRTVRLHPFLATAESEAVKPIGCEEARWVRPPQLREYKFPAANDSLIEQVLQRLVKR